MIRRWSIAGIALLAGICMFAACANTRGDAPGDPQATTAAVAITYQLAGQHLPQVYSRFDPQLSKALPPDQMAKLWHGFESKYGSFDSASAIGNRQHGREQTDVVVACHFQKGTQYLDWTLANVNMQVTALHLAGGS